MKKSQYLLMLGIAAMASSAIAQGASEDLAISIPAGWRVSADANGVMRMLPANDPLGQTRISVIPPIAAQGSLAAQAQAGMLRAELPYRILSQDLGMTVEGHPVLMAYGADDQNGARVFFLAAQRKGQFSMVALEGMGAQALQGRLGAVSELTRHWLGNRKENSAHYEHRVRNGYATASAHGSASGDNTSVQTSGGQTGNGGAFATASSRGSSSQTSSSSQHSSSSHAARDSQSNSSRDSRSDRQERIVFDGSSNQFRMVSSSEQRDVKIDGDYRYENSGFGGSLFASSAAPLFARISFDGQGTCTIGSAMPIGTGQAPVTASYKLNNGSIALGLTKRPVEHHSFIVLESRNGVATKLAIGGCVFNRIDNSSHN